MWEVFIVAPSMANCIVTTFGTTEVMLKNESVSVEVAPQSVVNSPCSGLLACFGGAMPANSNSSLP
jgi:hypothetical protein